ncbi:hypothetical protein [Haladaptatus sp. NG-WS-4]
MDDSAAVSPVDQSFTVGRRDEFQPGVEFFRVFDIRTKSTGRDGE